MGGTVWWGGMVGAVYLVLSSEEVLPQVGSNTSAGEVLRKPGDRCVSVGSIFFSLV